MALTYLKQARTEALRLTPRADTSNIDRYSCESFYGGYGMANCNAVIYPAKALMELITAEKPLGEKSPEWRQRYLRHDASIKPTRMKTKHNRHQSRQVTRKWSQCGFTDARKASTLAHGTSGSSV